MARHPKAPTLTTQQRVAEQIQWIADHGGDLAGYLAAYGPSGEGIFQADVAVLRDYEAQAAHTTSVIPAYKKKFRRSPL